MWRKSHPDVTIGHPEPPSSAPETGADRTDRSISASTSEDLVTSDERRSVDGSMAVKRTGKVGFARPTERGDQGGREMRGG